MNAMNAMRKSLLWQKLRTPRDGPLLRNPRRARRKGVFMLSQGPNRLFHLLHPVTLNLWALAQLRAVAGLSNGKEKKLLLGAFLAFFHIIGVSDSPSTVFDPHTEKNLPE